MPQPLPPTAMLPVAPQPRRRAWPTWGALVAVGVLLAACGGVSGVWLAAQEQKSTALPDVTDSPTRVKNSPSYRSPSPSPSPTPTEVTVIRPDSLLGRKRAGDRVVNGLLDKAFDGLRPPQGEKAVSAAYGALTRSNLVLFWATTADNADPSARLDDLVAQASSAMKFRDVDPGPLGGVARCAGDGGAVTPTTVCMWVDRGSFGFVYFLFDDAARADELLAQARAEIEIAQ